MRGRGLRFHPEQDFQIRRFQGLGEQVALAEIALGFAQQGLLPRVLDALGHDAQTELVADFDDGAADGQLLGRVFDAIDESLPACVDDVAAHSDGAPGGVAVGKENAEDFYLKPGDVVECPIDGISTLSTTIVDEV